MFTDPVPGSGTKLTPHQVYTQGCAADTDDEQQHFAHPNWRVQALQAPQKASAWQQPDYGETENRIRHMRGEYEDRQRQDLEKGVQAQGRLS